MADKELLLKDLCARLPYLLYVQVENGSSPIHLNYSDVHFENYFNSILNGDIKPYLRPMSSMTDEEEKEFQEIKLSYHFDEDGYILFDWLNKKGFDYRGLIPMGLALEALEGMYNK